MIKKFTLPYPITIYIAGAVTDAQFLIRRFCFEKGLCVTVTPTNFIYTGGEEYGVAVGLVNYPRFPKDQGEMDNIAAQLAEYLMMGMNQWSVLIQTPRETCWFSRKPEHDKEPHAS